MLTQLNEQSGSRPNEHHRRGRRRDQDAKSRIFQATLEVLDEVGFARTSVEAIAERAGTGKATVYRWWADKIALIGDALRDAAAHEVPFPYTGHFHEDLRMHVRSCFRLLQGQRRRVLRAFLVAAQSDPHISDIFRSAWWEARRRETKLGFGRYHDRLLHNDLDIEVILDMIYGSMYSRLVLGRSINYTEYADTVADILFDGIRRKSPNTDHS